MIRMRPGHDVYIMYGIYIICNNNITTSTNYYILLLLYCIHGQRSNCVVRELSCGDKTREKKITNEKPRAP